jgi:hypothetical protein
MTSLADVFAYLYTTDLDSLNRAVQEAARILAERQRASNTESSAQTATTNLQTHGS